LKKKKKRMNASKEHIHGLGTKKAIEYAILAAQ
jgi:hypothetical protein